MAKKRGGSPLGNAPGSIEAQQSAARTNLESLTKQLSAEIEKAGEQVGSYLQKQFGIEAVGQNVVWKLASGQTATFNEVTLSHEQVRDNTLVTFDVNGRDQSMLTAESLEDLNSLEFQQFYPAVGREVDGKIDVLDGSRRRAWFLLQQGRVKTFRILVTQDDISITDAKALAKQLQTAKEHNQREIGLQCKAIMESGECTQEEVAQILGISRQAVGRALKAASIDAKLIALFPVVNELSHTDYAVLAKVMNVFANDSKKLSSFIQKVAGKVVNAQPEQSQEELKDSLIASIKSELKIAEAKQEKDTAAVTPLPSSTAKACSHARK